MGPNPHPAAEWMLHRQPLGHLQEGDLTLGPTAGLCEDLLSLRVGVPASPQGQWSPRPAVTCAAEGVVMALLGELSRW